jgi:protein-tyrosine phosphatase
MSATLRGAPNFRDLGGLRARDGRVVQHGRLLRSGQLGELEPADVALLRKWLGRNVWLIDLRGAAERTKRVCALPDAVVHSVPIEPSVAARLDALAAAGEPLTAQAARGFMAQAYCNFARNAHAQLTALFDHAVARGGDPLVVHCTAGKDRTGFMVAMLLGALGIDRETILADYLETNRRVSPRESGRYPAQVLRELGLVRAEYLDAAFRVIDDEFGGLNAYLGQAAALTPERRSTLQRLLLNP